MTKFKEAMARLYTNVFVCRVCKAKMRADPLKVKQGKIKCRSCFAKQLRVKHKEIKGGGAGSTAAAPTAPAAAKKK
jgi:ribosomal protein L40E